MPHDTAGQPLTLEQLRLAIASITGLQPGDIDDNDNLLLLGVDSMGIMRLVNMWRKEGIRVSSRELVAEPTLVAWQRHIDALRVAAEAERALPRPRLAIRPAAEVTLPPGSPGNAGL